jgi:hypothetical protein
MLRRPSPKRTVFATAAAADNLPGFLERLEPLINQSSRPIVLWIFYWSAYQKTVSLTVRTIWAKKIQEPYSSRYIHKTPHGSWFSRLSDATFTAFHNNYSKIDSKKRIFYSERHKETVIVVDNIKSAEDFDKRLKNSVS